ncbi:hypothetical protein KC669_03035 [Candidatus Dojkabacteria bacterium]|uniref:Uncharacterized protein n=1 Tax=Candidatus Dojkabacteria bacterium TaxID=2099670 RepID=A0A955LB78_9BACT|nr:hypothetical protein [Candidatus Dojkabacteria bacterium]
MKKGMTLIETSLYLALFGMAFLMIVQFGLSMREYQKLALVRTEIQKSLVILNQEFLNSVSMSDSIDNISEFNTESGDLILNESSGNVTYRVENFRLVKQDSTSQIYLTPADMVISQFIFTDIRSDDGDILGIQINITLSYAKNNNVSESLSSTYAVYQ